MSFAATALVDDRTPHQARLPNTLLRKGKATLKRSLRGSGPIVLSD